jgi:hypothetical protein
MATVETLFISVVARSGRQLLEAARRYGGQRHRERRQLETAYVRDTKALFDARPNSPVSTLRQLYIAMVSSCQPVWVEL